RLSIDSFLSSLLSWSLSSPFITVPYDTWTSLMLRNAGSRFAAAPFLLILRSCSLKVACCWHSHFFYPRPAFSHGPWSPSWYSMLSGPLLLIWPFRKRSKPRQKAGGPSSTLLP